MKKVLFKPGFEFIFSDTIFTVIFITTIIVIIITVIIRSRISTFINCLCFFRLTTPY